jgi:hypothetical protein
MFMGIMQCMCGTGAACTMGKTCKPSGKCM